MGQMQKMIAYLEQRVGDYEAQDNRDAANKTHAYRDALNYARSLVGQA